MRIAQPGAHLDHLLRQTRWHHMQLSIMADAKANMMLTVSSVVITLIVRYLAEPMLRPAVITMIGFCLLTIILAAYAATPKLGLWRTRRPHPVLTDPTFNLLYFGDFVRLGFGEFESAMEEVMNDPSRTYEVQLRELYTLGVYLARKKYRFVQAAYLAFISGLVTSGIVLSASGWMSTAP